MQLPSWICPCRQNRVEPFVVVARPAVDQPPVNDDDAAVLPPEENPENPAGIDENPYLPAGEAQDQPGADENNDGTGDIQDHLGTEGHPAQDGTGDNQAQVHPDIDENNGQVDASSRAPTPFDPEDQPASTSWPARVASGISGTASRIVERIKGIARPSTPDSDTLSV